MPEITFRKAEEKDATLISQLADKIWREHYATMISPAQMDYMLERWNTPENLQQQMRDGLVITFIVVDEVPTGYVAVKEQRPGHFFVAKFYLDTSLHRQGIGTAAFQYLVNTLCKGFQAITLQVNRKNAKAINFYFKQGMVIDHAEDFDIGNGYSMDDFVMILRPKK